MDKTVPMLENIKEVFFSEEQIHDRITELGAQITNDYWAHQNEGITLVCILRGALLFMTDLAKSIDLTLRMDFLQAASYGNGHKSSGNVEITSFGDYDYAGQHVIIAEDIIDTGRTLNDVVKYFYDKGAADVAICAMLDKHKSNYDLPIKYTAFDCPNEFIVGYGLDFMQDYRNLPYIGVMKPEVYQELLDKE